MSNQSVSNVSKRYHPAVVTLHWLTVALMFGAFALVPEEGSANSSPVDIHMALGVLLVLVMLARVVARFTTKRPAWASTGNSLLDKVGELTHLALYFLIFVLLVAGGFIAYEKNLFAWALGLGEAVTHGFRRGGLFFIGAFHGLAWSLLFLLILLHIGAALYHQFILKDNLLARMWYGK